MKFLQTIGYLGLLVGLMAATSDPNRASMPVAEQQVECDGVIWTNNEYLGSWGDSYMVTKIVDNRIYVTNKGKYESNLDILLHLDTGRFPNNAQSQARIKKCINPVDPTVSGYNYLGPQTGDQIPCNGKILKKNEWITYYLGGDGAKSYSVVKIYDGLVRIHIVRKEQPNTEITAQELLQDPGPNNTNASLVENSFKQGNKNPAWPYAAMTKEEIDGCIYKETPKYPDRIITQPCTSNPVIGTISSISQTGLTFSFTGSGLPNLTWRIKPAVANASNERSGKTGAVSNAGVALTFASLPLGTYTLEIEGGDCQSTVSSKQFSVTAGPCITPSLTNVRNITSFKLNADFTGTNSPNTLAWKIKNSAGAPVAVGKTSAISGSTAEMGYPFLPNGNYTLEIQAGDCASSVSSRAFSINVTDSRSACKVAPDVRSVYNITQSSLFFNYYGEEIYSLDWRIRTNDGTNNGPTVANSVTSIVPVNDRPSINYSLPDGYYVLEIQGGPTCKSTPTAMAFTIGTPLPIHISRFEGKAVQEGIRLSWTVESEENGKGFQVLRFDDQARTPKIVGFVPLSEGRLGDYSFVDNAPAAGVNYYQLKQVDLDGTFTTSKIVSVRHEGLFSMLLAPNPARDYVDLIVESRGIGVANLETYSVSGVRILASRQRLKAGSNKVRVNIASLPEGSYVLRVQNEEQSQGLRFVKVQ